MRRLVPFVLLLAVLGGCSDDDAKDDEPAPTTTTVGATTTTGEPSTTTTGPATTTTCPEPSSTSVQLLVAAVDLDDDGVDEVWRAAGSGASVEIVELRRIDGCVELAVLLDGLPAQFAVGGTVTHLDGVRCDDDGRVVQLSATSDDGATYATVERTFRLEDGVLLLETTSTGASGADDDTLAAYATFTC